MRLEADSVKKKQCAAGMETWGRPEDTEQPSVCSAGYGRGSEATRMDRGQNGTALELHPKEIHIHIETMERNNFLRKIMKKRQHPSGHKSYQSRVGCCSY